MVYQNGNTHDPIPPLMAGINSLLENGVLDRTAGKYHVVEDDPSTLTFGVLEVRQLTPEQVVLIPAYGDQRSRDAELPPWAQQLTSRGYTVEMGHEFDFDRPQYPRGQYGRLYRVWR